MKYALASAVTSVGLGFCAHHTEPLRARQVLPVSSVIAVHTVTVSVEPMSVLSAFTTSFMAEPGRTTNIALAAGKLDGAVIAPGATLSFNDVVGIRSSAAGYVTAPVLLQGRRTPDLGGGVCQVSSTLHAAARHGHLIIKERIPHSLVPKYIEPGYDATVAFPESCATPGIPCGKLDLKILNPYGEPVTVRAGVAEADGGLMRLTVWLEGTSTACHSSASHWSEPLDRGGRRWVRSARVFDANYVKVVQQAAAGLVVWSTLTWVCPDKPDEVVRWFSRYPPVDEVWEVGWHRPRDAGPPWEEP